MLLTKFVREQWASEDHGERDRLCGVMLISDRQGVGGVCMEELGAKELHPVG